jgi:hypothetical protein
MPECLIRRRFFFPGSLNSRRSPWSLLHHTWLRITIPRCNRTLRKRSWFKDTLGMWFNLFIQIIWIWLKLATLVILSTW